MGAVGRQNARGLDSQASGDAGDQHPFAAQFDARKHIIGGGCRVKCFRHDNPLG